MRNYIANKKDRNFSEACWLFGEEDCKRIQALIDEGKDMAARKIIASWNIPKSACCECIRLILNCSNEEAKRWFELNGAEV